MKSSITKEISIRAVEEKDHDFIYSLFSLVCIEKLNAFDWPEQQKNLITKMQFRAHENHHKNTEKTTDHIILYRQEPSGRLITRVEEDHLCISDIAIHPVARNLGIASSTITWFCKQAEQQRRSVKLHVDKSNHLAIRLYSNLGFSVNQTMETDYEMIWPISEIRTA